MQTYVYMTKPLRSQPARDRILAAATSVFAREGYDRATIRAIADEAQVNPAIVIRYYGSKEELFVAATPLDLRAEGLIGVPRDRVGEALVRHVLARWDDPVTGAELAGLLRASVSHEAARARIVAVFDGQVRGLVAALMPAGDADAVAALIAAQILGLALTRYVLRLPGVAALPAEAIVREVGAAVQGWLDGSPARP